MNAWLPWRVATERALYGPDGFYRRAGGPAAHFRTSVHASRLFAVAVLRLLDAVDAALGRPARLDLVDVGAGRGELLAQIAALAGPRLAGRLRLHGVEVADRGLPAGIAWSSDLPRDVTGLVLANEWLDNVPVDVVELTPEGVRLVLVDPATGAERLGDAPEAADLAWLARWWPLSEPGARAEVGRPRDAAWARAVRSLRAGVAVAVDYGHLRAERAAGAYPAGTLTGYRGGRGVRPVPDGSCDVTAHVAVDACAAAGEAAGARGTALLTQRDALHRLGISGARPPLDLASREPRAYLAALAEASEAAELTARGGLGDFWWLAQSVGIDLPVHTSTTSSFRPRMM